VAPLSRITEGGHGRPSNGPLKAGEADRMNKWCARECERCRVLDLAPGEQVVPAMLPDLKNPQAPRPVVLTRREKREAENMAIVDAVVDRMTPEQLAAIDRPAMTGAQLDRFRDLYADYSKRLEAKRTP